MDVEYEVESIVKAKVFMRGKKMGWKFYVKWKGYQDTDNTWEPFKSFENSGEGIVERFWDRIDTKGRDVNSIEGWTNGEEVYPMGPPRRKSRTSLRNDERANVQSPTDEHPISRGTTNGTRAKRPLESSDPKSSSKRKRASSSRRKSDTQPTAHVRRKSHSPVPDSQAEDELLMDALPKTASDDTLADAQTTGLVEQVDLVDTVTSSVPGPTQKPKHRSRPPTPSRVPDPVNSQPRLPTMVDEINFLVPGADPPQQLTASSIRDDKSSRTGLKGRNASLLTFSKKKGTLETLRRSRAAKVNEAVGGTGGFLESTSATSDGVVLGSASSSVEIPIWDGNGTAPAAEEMKMTSGEDFEGQPLPDYEEQKPPCSPSLSAELPDKMPTSISFPEPLSCGSNPWKRATIFGPLATGASLPTWAASSTSDTGVFSSIPKPFLLSLDNSISVPVTLKDVSSEQTIHQLHLENIISGTSGPPGKLYTSHAATTLLETLETGGSCARLVPGDTATVDQRRVFDAFCTKLEQGGLFVMMASSEVLACCSSTNEDYTKKLTLATALRGLSGTVVVSHVKVANYSAFADAAAQAENVRW